MTTENFITKSLLLIVFVCLIFIVFSKDKPSEKEIFNPIIPGFNPDPSICRVGSDYYVVTSSNEYYPGLPIYHSRNLVNWKIIGHALNRPSQLNLDSVNCSGGIYAPTIRYQNGVYYIISTLAGVPKDRPRGNFLVTAKNPAGPWSDPVWFEDAPGIDPSLFFDDDGKVYYHGNLTPSNPVWDKHRNIWIRELDLKTMKLTGRRYVILDGSEYYRKGNIDGGIVSGVNNFEAPHIYRKNGFYYLVIAHGGTFQNHAVSVWRSREIFGPYENNPSNPILTHRDLPATFEITSAGHADLVDSPDGKWWMVFHARRPYGGEFHILGRETFLSAVDWSGDWPVVNPGYNSGRAEFFIKQEKQEVVSVPLNQKDDFDENSLDLNWNFLRTPRTQWWSLSERKNYLRIYLRPERISELTNPSFVCRRQEQPDFSAVTKLEFNPASDNEEAGLVVERDIKSYFRFSLGTEKGKPKVRLFQQYPENQNEEMLAENEVISGTIYIKISSSGVLYTFSYSRNGTDWIVLKENVDGRFLGANGLGRFTGTLIGMYASSNGHQSRNYADFDWFIYTNNY